jgi:hypothetical protein
MKFLSLIDMTGQLIQNVASPGAGTDAANKNYVDNLINGLAWKQPVRAATTANIANVLTGAPNTLDGVTLVATDRVLVKDQTTQSGNGVYTVTTVGTGANGVWARSTDMDAANEFVNATVYVSEGTVNADKAFTQTANAPITVGTTNLSWAQVGGGSAYTAGNGLQLSTSTFSVLADPVAGGGISVTASGVKVDTAVVVRKFAQLVGDGSTTNIPVTHNLATQDVQIDVRDASTNQKVQVDFTSTSTTVTTLNFATAPTTNQYRVTVQA